MTSAQSLEDTWAYDPLGQVASLGYPRCKHAGCTATAVAARTVTPTDEMGYLRTVTGYANRIELPRERLGRRGAAQQPADRPAGGGSVYAKDAGRGGRQEEGATRGAIVKITMTDLRTVTDRLFAHLERNGWGDVDVAADYYWNIPKEQLYDRYEEPTQLDIGQISDNWMDLTRIASGESAPVADALVWLAAILRAIGDQVTAVEVKQ